MLTSVDENTLPRLIRFSKYLNAVTETPSIINQGEGVFILTDGMGKIAFKVTN